jgi:hypothetical protein
METLTCLLKRVREGKVRNQMVNSLSPSEDLRERKKMDQKKENREGESLFSSIR